MSEISIRVLDCLNVNCVFLMCTFFFFFLEDVFGTLHPSFPMLENK